MLNPQAARMRTAARRLPPCLQILMHCTAEPEVPTFLVPMSTHNILSTTTFESPRHYFGMLKIICEKNKKYVFCFFAILIKTNSHLTNAFFMFYLFYFYFSQMRLSMHFHSKLVFLKFVPNALIFGFPTKAKVIFNLEFVIEHGSNTS